MEAAFSSETLLVIYQTTRRHVSEDPNLNIHSRENLKTSPSTLKMEAACFDEMLVPIYHTTRCHIPDDRNLDASMTTSNITIKNLSRLLSHYTY
jgi:hypothetical protein